MQNNRITTLDELFAEVEAENQVAYDRWSADPIAQERLRREVELRAAAAAAEPEELEAEQSDEDEDEDDEQDEDEDEVD
jgi:hypothetical protein